MDKTPQELAENFTALLISVLRGQFPTISDEAATARAEAIAKLICAKMIKEDLAVIRRSDLHMLSIPGSISGLELAAAGKQRADFYAALAVEFARHLPNVLLRDNHIRLATEDENLVDPQADVKAVASIMIYSPGATLADTKAAGHG